MDVDRAAVYPAGWPDNIRINGLWLDKSEEFAGRIIGRLNWICGRIRLAF